MMSRIVRAALAIGASAAVLVGSATTAYADQSTDNPSFVRLRAEHSDKCLTIENARIGSGAHAVQQSCSDDLDNQLFDLRSSGEGKISVWAKHSGRCLGSGSNTDWDVEQLWCIDNSGQHWRVILVEVAKDLYELRPAYTPVDCLTIPNFSQADGTRARTLKCTGDSNQRWRIQPATS
ncbi:RICIN domain-containing protein [Streptomyces olivoreticuli]